MTPEGDDHRQVTSTGREMHFSWSPDGARIVFERWSPIRERADLGTAESDLFIVDVVGTNEEQITNDGVSRDPAWSPDGTQIAFVHGPRGNQHVAVIGVDGNGLRDLAARADNLGGIPYGNRVTWSPDGALIAFSGLMNDDTCHISTVDPFDGSVRTLISMPASDDCPGQYGMSWAPEVRSSTPSVSPAPQESPSAEPTPDGSPSSAAVDIGLGFPVCNVTSVAGEFAIGVQGAAYVATRTGDTGGCPDGGFHVVAVDVTGDGVADASYGPIECENLPCSAFAAPDVDGDGTDELLVENIAFSIAGLRLYEVREDPAEVFPVTVATPGYPEGGLEPGAEPQFWIGGDEFQVDTLRCVDDSASRWSRVLIRTSASQVPPDRTDSVWQTTRTWLGLNPDGTLSIVDVGSFDVPNDDPDGVLTQGSELCGAQLPSPYGEP
jgi:hypothetical protein